MVKPGNLFIVSAPSGAGKTSLVSKALELLSDKSISRAITYTTKNPRKGEMHGKDYYFISKAEFEEKIQQDYFLEYSTAYGYYYGTPRSYIYDIESGHSYIMIIDRAGAQQITKQFDKAILIWICVKDLQTLKARLQKRNDQNEQEIERRLQVAVTEIDSEQKNPMYMHYIVNDTFCVALEELCAILQGRIDVESTTKVTNNIKNQTFEIRV